jgi:hypothetical protein
VNPRRSSSRPSNISNPTAATAITAMMVAMLPRVATSIHVMPAAMELWAGGSLSDACGEYIHPPASEQRSCGNDTDRKRCRNRYRRRDTNNCRSAVDFDWQIDPTKVSLTFEVNGTFADKWRILWGTG